MRILLAALIVFVQAPVPVEQEPRHTVRYADSTLRVLEVDIPPGDTTLDHMHRHDIATVCLECADTRSRPPGGEWSDVRTRAVGSASVTEYTARPGAHGVRNISATQRYHLIAVENLGSGGLRMIEKTLAPQERMPGHTHAVPTVVVNVGARTWEVVKPGFVHGVVNGPNAMRLVEIEVQ